MLCQYSGHYFFYNFILSENINRFFILRLNIKEATQEFIDNYSEVLKKYPEIVYK